MISPFNRPKDKLTEELEALEKTKADLERRARELEVTLNIPPDPPKEEEERAKGARFVNLEEEDKIPDEIREAQERSRLKIEQRNAKKRFLWLIGIVVILLLLILKVAS